MQPIRISYNDAETLIRQQHKCSIRKARLMLNFVKHDSPIAVSLNGVKGFLYYRSDNTYQWFDAETHFDLQLFGD